MGILDTLQSTLDDVTKVLLVKNDNKEQQNWFNPTSTEVNAIEITTQAANQVVEEEKKKIAEKKGFCYPVQITRVTSPYGWRIFGGQKVWHNGTDYTGYNKYTVAPSNLVIKKFVKPDYDYPCRFKYDETTKTWIPALVPAGRAWTPYITCLCACDAKIRFTFRHIDILPNWNVGDIVQKGESIALLGNWGYSQGSHLHFEVELFDGVKWNSVDGHKFLTDKISEA
jgi:hypothetical protein